MAKQFTTIREITGEELKATMSEGFGEISKAVKEALEEGKKHRVTILDKQGNMMLQTPAFVGLTGLGLSMILLPIFSLLAAVTVFVAGVVCDYKLVIEKEVEGAAPSESVKA